MSIKGRIGFYTITPVGELEATARAISVALGVDLRRDQSGDYEEFPAFVASASALQFALLGNPKPADDFRDHPTDDFELQVSVIEDRLGYETTGKIDEFILSNLRAKGVVVTGNGWGT